MPATVISHFSRNRRHYGRLVWLLYLLIYPLPWLEHHPSTFDITASAAALIAFFTVYFTLTPTYPTRPWQALAMAAIGFSVSTCHGAWAVYLIYALTTAARIEPHRKAALIFILVQATMFAWCGWRSEWIDPFIALIFGSMASVGALIQTDLARRNRQLLAAQSEVRSLAASSERERIARDLHDLLGHSLTVIAIKAELASRLHGHDPARAQQEMNEIAHTARESLREVRTAVTGMKGASLALELDRARTALASANIALTITGTPTPIAPEQDGVLAMSLREAVTNVLRHSSATTCHITFHHHPDTVTAISIEDNGQTHAPIEEGNGLTGMRARLTAAGGALDIRHGHPGLRLTATMRPA